MSPTPDSRQAIVTNTTPLIALTAATGGLDILLTLYCRVLVPFEVEEELHAAGMSALGVAAFSRATWLERASAPVTFSNYLRNTLDRGEASVIQTALNERVPLVCIDETVGRRVARLSGLALTGSVGVLIKAKQAGYPLSIRQAIANMREHGLWLSESVVRFALDHDT